MTHRIHHALAAATPVLRTIIGKRSDWMIARPDFGRLRPSVSLLGPLAIIATTVAGWFAFSSAQGDGPVALGLFVGAASIVLMAWSFVLALRLRFLEPVFGGLDRAYQAHRWAGSLAVPLMFLHARLEPEVEGGVLGASDAVAEAAADLAGTGELMIYGLVGASLIRWLPYRIWRHTHKLLGIPFGLASWHFVTAEKTFHNASGWGAYFGAIMAAGCGAWIWRVVLRPVLTRGHRYLVVSAESNGADIDLRLAPVGKPLSHRLGQFATVQVKSAGLGEPHPFTIASSPGDDHLRFVIRDLGDWSARMQRADLVGAEVRVDGPYGHFRPLPKDDRAVCWVAGGVGITPFLGAIAELTPQPAGHRPTLLYCVRNRSSATALDELEAADSDGRIDLVVLASSEGRRFSDEVLESAVGRLDRAHVAACGPAGLLAAVTRAARHLGAARVESEAFDIRSGIGPDLSEPLDANWRKHSDSLQTLARLRPASNRLPSVWATSRVDSDVESTRA